MFEYLMPLLMLRSHPETLLGHLPQRRCGAQIHYGRRQRRAVGHLGVGLQRRGPARQLPVQGVRRPGPRAQARARRGPGGRALRDGARRHGRSRRRRANFRRLAREGAAGPYGFYEALDYTPRKGSYDERRGRAPIPPAVHGRAGLLRPPPGHEPGRARERPARRPDGAPLPLRSARAGHRAAAAGARAALRARHPAAPRRGHAGRAAVPAVSPRRFRSPHTLYPHAHFLSNGQYITVVTNAGGGASIWRGRAVTRQRDDATCDPGSQFIYLRDVRSGSVWSADLPAGVPRGRRTTA